MSEELDKSENATPFKLREARGKGQVAKSMELNHSIILLIFVLAGAAFWSEIAVHFSSFFEKTWLSGSQVIFDKKPLIVWFEMVVSDMFQVFGPLVLTIMFAGILANLLQTGVILSTHSLKPDFNRLNPVQGLKKIFSMTKFFELIKSSIKLVLIGVVLYLCVNKVLPLLIKSEIIAIASVDDFIVSKVILVSLIVIVALSPITIIDIIFTRKEFAKKMRMSKREVKEEHKKHEGSPEIKSKRKQIQKELLKKSSALSQVQEADLIVVNPTHYAVGLKYDPKTMAAPIVVVKGRGVLAQRIRELAQRYGKTFFRRPITARALYKYCEVEHPISAEQFSEVAEIYRNYFALKEQY